MAELAIIVFSSLQIPPNSSSLPKPSCFPPRRSSRRKLPRSPSRPLLSDVRKDLTSPASSSAPSTRLLLKYYARLASKLAEDGRLTDFLMIAESVLTSDAVAAESPQFVARVDTRMVSRGISAVLRGGDLDRVVDFMSAAEKLGFCPSSLFDESAVQDLGVECGWLLERGRFEEFVGLMETLAGYRFHVQNIADPDNALRVFVGRRDVHMAIRYACIFPHSQLLLCTIMKEFGRKHDLESALRTFEAIKQKFGGYNMFACRTIIDVCGLCGDLLTSRSLFEELLSQKITPNIYVYNSLMNVNACDLTYALYIFGHMQASGVNLDVASYNIILKACCNAKRVDLAQDIYKELKDLASKGVVRLDVITYSTMIKVLADAKMWQMALKIKGDMLLADVRPNIVTWSSLMSAFADAGQVDRAIQIFEEMITYGVEPNAHCCNILLNACVESCQHDRAFRLFRTWKKSGIRSLQTVKQMGCDNSHVSLSAGHLTRDGSIDSTCSQPLGNMVLVPFRPTVATFNILMKACGSDHYRAKSLMDEMKIMGLAPNHISWSILIHIYGISQNIWAAIQAFKTMRDVGIKPDVIAYTTAIKACVESKNPKIAFSLFEEMKKLGLRPNLVTYNALLRARSRYGSLHEVQQCLTIYQEMRKAGYAEPVGIPHKYTYVFYIFKSLLARYNSNDYYLKELLEEWCEGVISDRKQNQNLLNVTYSHSSNDIQNPYGLLIQKVAAYLQKDVGENQAIDIRGLTQVEARIVVLSVLRMIKERYQIGETIKDDLLIICGVKGELVSCSREFEVRLAIMKVLQIELGLKVTTGHGAAPVTDCSMSSPGAIETSPDLQKTERLQAYKYMARRPQEYGLLKVTKESLYHWLQKKARDRASF